MTESEPAVRRIRWGIVILRVMLGAIFLANGLHRLSRLDFQRGIDLFEIAGSQSQTVDGVLITLTECLGGAALVSGWFTRCAAGLLALDVLLGIWVIDVSAATFLPSGGKLVLILLGALTTILFAGSGGFGLDEVRKRRYRLIDELEVAVRLEESRGKKLARCIVTVRNRCGGEPDASAGRAEIWHGRLSA